ncbi:MAG: acetoin utilization protein AcuB [Planctomycetota bacterium]|jgi:acetoin utilization protein AcuB
MLVRHFMSTQVTTLTAETTCREAWLLFKEQRLRRAPVLEDGKVLGMLTDRDLMRVLPWTPGQADGAAEGRDQERPVGSLLAKTLISVTPKDHLEVAAERLLRHKIGGLPVIQDGQLMGIITESDLFRTFVSLKASAKGTRLTLHWPSARGRLIAPTRIALATGMQLHEYIEHANPSDGTLIGMRVAGRDIENFIERILDVGFLLLDREDPRKT